MFERGRYPALSKLVKALLSCFHGPQVEGSFSSMGNILDSIANRMTVQTFSAIQSIKYSLRAADKTSVEYFGKEDYLHDRVDGDIVRNMRGVYKVYSREQVHANAENVQKKEKFGVSEGKVISKRKAADQAVIDAKRARLA